MRYLISQAAAPQTLSLEFDSDFWGATAALSIAQFREESSAHRPITRAKMLYSQDGIYGIFQVHDQYVRCVQSEFQSLVCKDSCVEVYFEPLPNKGYINLEISGNGTLLSYYITDSTRAPGGFKDFIKLTPSQGRQVQIITSLPKQVEPEVTEPLTWTLAFFIPFSLIEDYVGPLGDMAGQVWRGNLFKCADESSHPHWASWQAVPELNFHMPAYFGEFAFA